MALRQLKQYEGLEQQGVQPVLVGGTAMELMWLLNSAYLVLFGVCGYAMLEAGHVRTAASRQVLFKVVRTVGGAERGYGGPCITYMGGCSSGVGGTISGNTAAQQVVF